jgi:hypothetical protein
MELKVKLFVSVMIMFGFSNFCCYKAIAQVEDSDLESWWGLMTSGQFSQNGSFWLDTHHVPNLFWIYRAGLTYAVPDSKAAVTVGYAGGKLATSFSEGNLIRSESRPWGQLVYRVNFPGPYRANFRFRYDMRFRDNITQQQLLEDMTLEHRLRYNISLTHDWGKTISRHFDVSATLFNESLFSRGKGTVAIPFEHRTFLFWGFRRSIYTISPGYHLRYQDRNGNGDSIRHGFVLWIQVNYQFKKLLRRQVEFPSDKM